MLSKMNYNQIRFHSLMPIHIYNFCISNYIRRIDAFSKNQYPFNKNYIKKLKSSKIDNIIQIIWLQNEKYDYFLNNYYYSS